MAVIVTVDLLTGSYDAAEAADRRVPEWPPHPARLFCALVAAARTEHERDALRWLERQEPPFVQAAVASGATAAAFVVTNEVAGKGGNQNHPGRSNQLRVRSRSFPAAPRVRFEWAKALAEPSTIQALDAMCRRVPYIGRSTGVALVSAAAAFEPGQGTGSAAGSEKTGSSQPEPTFEPCDVVDADVLLRIPYAGYVAALDELHEADRPAWQAARTHGYRARVHTGPHEADRSDLVPPSVYTDVVIFRFQGLRPQGRLAPQFTERLRSRVLGRAGDDAPAALHGHGANGRPHVAFLALPDVGLTKGQDGRRPAGHLLGLAVALPELPVAERKAVLSAVLGLRRPLSDESVNGKSVVDLSVPGIGQVELSYEPGLVRPWGVTPERWRLGSHRWTTATPVVLDRYPKRRSQEADVILRSVRDLGLPDPCDIQVSSEPLMPGAVRLRPTDLPRQVSGRLYRHVSLTFDQKVPGPLLLGAGRYLGVGLFAPEPEVPVP